MSQPEFELYNPPQVNQNKSRLQNLIDIGAFEENFVMEAMERLDSLHSPHVAAFFQLPQPIFAQDKIYTMPAERADTQIDFRFRPFLLKVTPTGAFTVTPVTTTEQKLANATLGVAYVPLWGRWALGYERYERCFTPNGLKDEIVLTDKEYGRGHTLRAKSYEYDLSSRLVPEVVYALRRFLKSYSTIVKAQYAQDRTLYGTFLMPYPGRFTNFGTTIPLAARFVSGCIANFEPVEAQRIQRGVEFTYRTLSRFEIQIFELTKLARSGNHALALTGALSLIEWVLKVMAPPEQKAGNLAKLTRYFSTRGLSDDVELLTALRELRNESTHLGEHAHKGDRKPHEILTIDIDQTINEETARKGIDVAWRVFQKANSGALTRQ